MLFFGVYLFEDETVGGAVCIEAAEEHRFEVLALF
jgi:hypothetical protein